MGPVSRCVRHITTPTRERATVRFAGLPERIECNSLCLNCVNGTRTGCTSCWDKYWYYEPRSECLTDCVSTTYAFADTSGKAVCLNCVAPCETCVSEAACTTCVSGYFLNTSQSVCVTTCPDGTYPNNGTRMCTECNVACLNCDGPTSKDCGVCNFAAGYARAGETGECYHLSCAEGTFLSKNYTTSLVSCEYCDPSCLTCDNTGKENCTECLTSLLPIASADEVHVLCKSCEDISSGFATAADGTCKGKDTESKTSRDMWGREESGGSGVRRRQSGGRRRLRCKLQGGRRLRMSHAGGRRGR